MDHFGFFEAWSHWRAGEQIPNAIVWGHPVWYWARIGKLLQFLAGTLVVIDIIGAKRLRQTALALEGPADSLYSGSWLLALAGQRQAVVYAIVTALAFVLFAVLVAFDRNYFWAQDLFFGGWGDDLGLQLKRLAMVAAFLTFFIYAIRRLLIKGPLVLVGRALQIVASIMSIREIEILGKWAALCLFVVGFVLDLLSS